MSHTKRLIDLADDIAFNLQGGVTVRTTRLGLGTITIFGVTPELYRLLPEAARVAGDHAGYTLRVGDLGATGLVVLTVQPTPV